MKRSRSEVRVKSHALPELRFEAQSLTSFAGLVIFQKLFSHLKLRARLRACFRHRTSSPIFAFSSMVMLLVVHLLLGYRELRHSRFYRDDPMVLRVLGLRQLPDVATISRQLANIDEQSVANLESLTTELVLQRLARLELQTLTLDFDGSVIGTSRRAEGSAIGFNKAKKGQRSYYPLLCTVAQSGQVLSVLNRSGNVHDSNGARAFIVRCIALARQALPSSSMELRMDSAFFSDEIVAMLDSLSVRYTISVPFERFAELKEKIEKRERWHDSGNTCECFEQRWKPKSWARKRRFLFVRQHAPVARTGPLQLDLFVPVSYQYSYKVILTNRSDSAADVIALHNGRGSQEALFAELKSQNSFGYIPGRTWRANRVYMQSAILAHNLVRELQMSTRAPTTRDSAKRPALWVFDKLETVRLRVVQRAGRLISPNGKLTLSMSSNDAVRKEILDYLGALDAAA